MRRVGMSPRFAASYAALRPSPRRRPASGTVSKSRWGSCAIARIRIVVTAHY
jgi:hypothetical protein